MQSSNFALVLLIISLGVFVFSMFYVMLKREFGYIALIFCIYHVVFFILPGVLHTADNIFPFYLMSYGEDIQIQTSVILLLFTLFFFSGFFCAGPYSKSMGIYRYHVSGVHLALVVIGLIAFQLSMLAIFGLDAYLVSRKDFSLTDFSENSSVAVMALGASRSASFLSVLFLVYFRKSMKGMHLYILLPICSVLFFIICYPLALSRFLFFSYLLTFLYLYSAPSVKNKIYLFLAFVLGVTTVFPILSIVTRGDGVIKFDLVEYYKRGGDFDGYQSMLNVVQYVSEHFISFGYQMLGAVLVFIPRAVWESKPFATGQVAAENAGYAFTNISAPIFSEIYMDFGYLGATVVAFLFGWLIRKFDSFSLQAKRGEHLVGVMACAIIFSFSCILLRGSLLAVIGDIALEMIVAVVVLKLILLRTSDGVKK